MNSEDSPPNQYTQDLAEAIAQPVSELLILFLLILGALRKQPNFDEASFITEIQSILSRGNLSKQQQMVLSGLIEKSNQIDAAPDPGVSESNF